MFKDLFGCCNELTSLTLYQRKPRPPPNAPLKSGRTSRFIQVTTDPLRTIIRESPEIIKKNKTMGSEVGTRYDTRGSNNQEEGWRKGEQRGWKPRTPIMDLEGLMESRVVGNGGSKGYGGGFIDRR